jgi:NAD(P)-dependent dehydrogenase (short-subunit alcohol dehydrogenase family)
VRNPNEIEQVIDTTYQEFGGIDILVNNAAFETDTSPEAIDLERWTAIVETDFRAYWLAAKYAYPYLSKSSHGTVINIGSNHSLATHPKKFPYNAIKTGIDGMTRAMAVAWGADGIRVNSVNPGWTMVERINENLTAAEVSSLERIHPVGRIGRPGDIADAVFFFASSMSSFVTGECLVIDGGRSAVLQDDLYVADLRSEAAGFGEPNSNQ